MKKLMILLIVLGLASSASALEVKIDFGGDGELDASWTGFNGASGEVYAEGGITITLSNSGCGGYARTRGGGAGDNLVKDCLAEEDPGGGTYAIAITGLSTSTEYVLETYFNYPLSYGSEWSAGTATQTLSGGASGSVNGSVTHEAADIDAALKLSQPGFPK